MLDFLFMVPKLSIRLREAFFSSRTTDGKARASGYAHTHTNTWGIDLAALSTYPSNEEIEEAANQGYQEAHSLFAYLGATATQIYRPGIATLPGINAWFMGDGDYDEDEDEDPLAETDIDGSNEDREFQLFLDDLEDIEPDTSRGERLLSDFRHASIALSVDEQMKMYAMLLTILKFDWTDYLCIRCAFPELDEDALIETYSDDALHIATTLEGVMMADSLPPVQINEHANPFDIEDPSTLDLQELVNLRFAHQTKQGATGVKNYSHSAHADSSLASDKTGQQGTRQTERQKLLHRFAEIIKQQCDKGIGTGLERSARWRKITAGESEGLGEPTGNAKNAAASAKAAATKVSNHY